MLEAMAKRSDETIRQFMRLAIQEMARSECDPKVGAVLVKDGKVVATGCKVTDTHAERVVIEKALAENIELDDATLYTTLEPCVSLQAASTRESCTDLIISVGIPNVVVGCYDMHPDINRKGWRKLRDAGIELKDFDTDLRHEINEINQVAPAFFTTGVGPQGGARFDYRQNGGRFEIKYSASDRRSIPTIWQARNEDSIYAQSVSPAQVALAKYANDFSQIDDPSAFDFKNHYAEVGVGEIAVFLVNDACALVKVVGVSGRFAKSNWVNIQFQVRVF